MKTTIFGLATGLSISILNAVVTNASPPHAGLVFDRLASGRTGCRTGTSTNRSRHSHESGHHMRAFRRRAR
jgi:hypothetical protein